MSTMNISLPDALKSFVDEQVAKRGYATSSEYVRELIRADQDREHPRKLLLDGAASKTAAAVDEAISAASGTGLAKPKASEQKTRSAARSRTTRRRSGS